MRRRTAFVTERERERSGHESRPCPECGSELAEGAAACRSCFAVVDRERWRHDAGRLGADARGGGRELRDPPAGPVPLTGAGVAGGELAPLVAAAKPLSVGKLLKWGRRS